MSYIIITGQFPVLLDHANMNFVGFYIFIANNALVISAWSLPTMNFTPCYRNRIAMGRRTKRKMSLEKRFGVATIVILENYGKP